MADVDIAGLNKAEVLWALYGAAKPVVEDPAQLRILDGPLSLAEAEVSIERSLKYEYLGVRPLHVDISVEQFDPYRFDLFNGEGSAAQAIANLRSYPQRRDERIRKLKGRVLPD